MTKNVVLIIGDFIIDRTWLVGEPALSEQHNSHYDVHPRNLVDPRREPDVAGGVGTIARALAGVTGDVNIIVMGAWSNYFETERARLLPLDDFDPQIAYHPPEFRRAAYHEFTNVKSRFYMPEISGARLAYRFDRNNVAWTADSPPPLTLTPEQWPDPADVRMAILGDYGFGLLHAREIQARVREYKAAGADVLLRSWNHDVIERYEWDLLTLNLHLFARYSKRERPFDLPVTRQIEGACTYHPTLIRALADSAAVTQHPASAVLLNIEQQGALVVQNRRIKPIILAAAGVGLNIGIGANDVVLAQVAKGLLTHSGSFAQRLDASAPSGVRAGSVFGARARKLDELKGWYAPRLTVTDADLSAATAVIEPSGESAELDKEIMVIENFSRPRKSEIWLHDAAWYLDNFVTVDADLGEEIVRLKANIRDYTRSTRARPFVAALCGEPGAGKTTLAQRIGEVTDCEVIIENVAQWTSIDDLFAACERIRTARMRGRTPLAFIDEVDARLDGQMIYSKLLSPVWDGAYFLHGQERTLGHPTIFLLAGSTQTWKTAETLLKAAHSPTSDDKLPDLVSRLSATPLEIPSLDQRVADVLYMAAAHIKRKFPRVSEAENGIFRLFTKSKMHHGARSIAAVVDLFWPPPAQTLRTEDLHDDKDLALHFGKIVSNWRDDHDVVKIHP